MIKSKFKVGDYVITNFSSKTNCNLKGKIIDTEKFYSCSENGTEIVPLYRVHMDINNEVWLIKKENLIGKL